MSRSTRLLLGMLLLAVLAAVAFYLAQNLRPYSETVEHGPSPEARGNPYLAAERFLQGRGLKVKSARGLDVLDQLPSKGQTLILLGSRENLTPTQSHQLLDWAARGGHLIVTAERLWDDQAGSSGDLLLDTLGVRQYLTEDLEQDKPAATPEGQGSEGKAPTAEDAPVPADDAEAGAPTPPDDASKAEEDDHYPELTKLYLENEQAPAYISFDTDYHLLDAKNLAYAWANSHNATHLLQLQQGDGLVTVLTDNWIWQTDNLERYDNAWLLWYLTQDSAVTLVYRAEGDSLATLLTRNYPQALLALALLLACALWRAGLRQGPLLPTPSRARRQLVEHLRASADFLLRQRGHIALLQGLQRDILRRARQRQPGFERLPIAEQWQLLGRMTRLPVSAISQAMRPYPAQRMSAADFTRQVAHLQSLRNAL
ncbi:DUF4350 domain-containing protein [Pseudomonas panipatensis]|uniref:DUF4350 domain-containing protein n=1 Tax=Pseudomonas panipatensis TaxID=428992 RepID=A0A1G8E7Q4_9PSED|nr:DUF4350 domain-containing protein [Pseudomonas panipatensis]SDH66008.1 protein of unknown function [Pseudomonas panipatensis]SMP38080.1 protein of unknown function [Pseudomonas panipatensis]